MTPEDAVYLTMRLSTYLGLGLFGMAAGLYMALMVIQPVVFTNPTIPLEAQAPALYPVLKNIQTAVNMTGLAGATGLVLGGVLDVYQEEVTAWISS